MKQLNLSKLSPGFFHKLCEKIVDMASLEIKCLEEDMQWISDDGEVKQEMLAWQKAQSDLIFQVHGLKKEETKPKMAVKYFHLQVEETNGEQGYLHDSLVVAKDEKEARKIADRHMRDMYDAFDAIKTGKEVYEFDDGNIVVQLYDLRETTKEEFLQRILQKNLLNPKGYDMKEAA